MKRYNVRRPKRVHVALCILSLLLAAILATTAFAQEGGDIAKGKGEELQTPAGQPGSVEDMTLLRDELHKWNKDMDVWFTVALSGLGPGSSPT